VPILPRKVRLLAVTYRPWAETEPFLRAFEEAGFATALVHNASGGRPLHDASISLLPAPPAQFGAAIERAVADIFPELILPTDAASFRHLAALYAPPTDNGRPRPAVAAALARAFGDPRGYQRVATAAALRTFARLHALPVPIWPEHETLLRATGTAAYCTLACRDGDMLASVGVERTEPGTRVRFLRDTAPRDIAREAAASLRLSGLVNCHFLLEREQPWLTGIEPFADPRLPLARPGEIGLADALHAAFAGGDVTWRAAS
jgi:hypothetical protein